MTKLVFLTTALSSYGRCLNKETLYIDQSHRQGAPNFLWKIFLETWDFCPEHHVAYIWLLQPQKEMLC